MKNQNNQRLQTILLAAIATIFLFGAFGSTFAQGVGAPYGARDPRTCADMKAPAKGAISAGLATKYVICGKEHIYGQSLYLAEDVTVQVGGGVPYDSNKFPFAKDIDPKSPVYPIRVNFKSYQCSKLSDILENQGKNCSSGYRPKAGGVCVRTTFGDWRCDITSVETEENIQYAVPPPGGAQTTDAAAPAKDKPIAAKDNKPTAAAKTADENKDDSAFPKPDFSEIEKWYEITRYEYGDIAARENRLFFWFKTKKAERPSFFVEYRDKDGALVQNGVMAAGEDGVLVSNVGDVGYGYAVTPTESVMKKVVSVKIVRDKD